MSGTTSDPPPDSSSPSPSTELKLFQTFIFSLPIFFSFILLFLFYWFYLRRRRVDWASLDMPTLPHGDDDGNGITRSELGLKKEIREMLPIIVYKESFSVHETQCSVCLGDYEAEEKLQQIPPCGHTFHMDCIDHWLATHTTCPLCRLSLLSPPKHEANSESPQETAVSEHREALAVEEEAVAVADEVKEVDFQLVGREAEVTSSM